MKPTGLLIAASLMLITPAMAADWLRRNKTNRPIRRPDVERIKADIRVGRWRINGETVKIDENGDLLDGQHRLIAIVETGASVQAFVVIGVPRVYYSTIDVGRKRTLSDLLGHEGHAHASALSSALGYYWRYEASKMEHKEALPSYETLVTDTLSRHPELTQSVAFIETRNKLHIAPSGGMAILHDIGNALERGDWIGSAKAPTQADRFFDSLLVGGNLGVTSPIFACRERLLHGTRNGGGLSGRSVRTSLLAPIEKLAYIVKTWNAVRTGKPLKILRWSNFGDHPETFPRMI